MAVEESDVRTEVPCISIYQDSLRALIQVSLCSLLRDSDHVSVNLNVCEMVDSVVFVKIISVQTIRIYEICVVAKMHLSIYCF